MFVWKIMLRLLLVSNVSSMNVSYLTYSTRARFWRSLYNIWRSGLENLKKSDFSKSRFVRQPWPVNTYCASCWRIVGPTAAGRGRAPAAARWCRAAPWGSWGTFRRCRPDCPTTRRRPSRGRCGWTSFSAVCLCLPTWSAAAGPAGLCNLTGYISFPWTWRFAIFRRGIVVWKWRLLHSN